MAKINYDEEFRDIWYWIPEAYIADDELTLLKGAYARTYHPETGDMVSERAITADDLPNVVFNDVWEAVQDYYREQYYFQDWGD